MNALMAWQCGQNEVFITIDEAKLQAASQKERIALTGDLFLGLTRAIKDYGCTVDISNPENIRISKD